jgi:hypothetical protein
MRNSKVIVHRIARWPVISAIGFVAAVPLLTVRSVEPTFLIGDVSVREPDTGSIAVVLTVSLATPVVHDDIAMRFSTYSGTATEGDFCTVAVDYVGVHNQLLTLSARQNSARITIQVCGDTRFEPNETFTVALLDGTGQVKKAEGRVTIIENDPAPVPWSGLTAQGTIAKSEEQRWQTPSLLPGDYVFNLGNGTGDADLYVRIGAPPTLTAYSCRPAKASADESCLVSLHVSDVIYVMVRGYATSSSFKLTGSAK